MRPPTPAVRADHLVAGLAVVGHGHDRGRLVAPVEHQVAQALGEHPGLARPRRGDDLRRARRRASPRPAGRAPGRPRGPRAGGTDVSPRPRPTRRAPRPPRRRGDVAPRPAVDPGRRAVGQHDVARRLALAGQRRRRAGRPCGPTTTPARPRRGRRTCWPTPGSGAGRGRGEARGRAARSARNPSSLSTGCPERRRVDRQLDHHRRPGGPRRAAVHHAVGSPGAASSAARPALDQARRTLARPPR